MKRGTVFLGILISAALMAGADRAYAQKKPMKSMKCEDNFSAMDTDKNNMVSLAEFTTARHPRGVKPEEIFKSRDTDKDGNLTMEEFCATAGKSGMGMRGPKGKFTEMDTDKDGKVSLQEFTAADHPRGQRPEEIFKLKDKNNDGYLTEEEFHSMGRGPGKGKNLRP